jgi:ABC-type transport system substrate-binding protein
MYEILEEANLTDFDVVWRGDFVEFNIHSKYIHYDTLQILVKHNKFSGIRVNIEGEIVLRFIK